MAPDPSGGWWVTGEAYGPKDIDAGVAKLTPSGQLDPTFSENGRAVVSVSPRWEQTRSVAALGDDAAIVTGCARMEGRPRRDSGDGYVLRLLASGRPDGAFGANGVVTLRTGGDRAFECVDDAQLLEDGAVLVAGVDDRGAFVARLLHDGRLDDGFGTRGVLRPIPTWRKFFGVQLIEDGRGGWAVLGEAAVSGSAAGGEDDRNFDLVAARLRRDGSPRMSFGRKGVKRVALSSERKRPDYDSMVSGAFRRGRLILAATDEGDRPVVLRLNSNGHLDRRYATKGRWRQQRSGEQTEVGFDQRGGAIVAISTGRRTLIWRLTASGAQARRHPKIVNTGPRHEIVRAIVTTDSNDALLAIVSGGFSFSGEVVIARIRP